MEFCDKLNGYINVFGCTAKELMEASGVSSAAISRYRAGERSPKNKSEQIKRLAYGLAKIAKEKNIPAEEGEIFKELCSCFKEADYDFAKLSINFDRLVKTLAISPNLLAKQLNFDTSYISRIRTGNRKPANPEEFLNAVVNYCVKAFSGEKRQTLARLIDANYMLSDTDLKAALKDWLIFGSFQKIDESMQQFLDKMDEFDLNEFIRVIHFNDIKIPTLLFQLPLKRTYYGLEGFKSAELDFFKATVLSKSQDSVFMCSSMPMDDMANDKDFSKKWMFGLAAMLKKGLHLDIIHNLDRPFSELMLGLESWIPMYMTGQISPYYFKNGESAVYNNLDYYSGAAAMRGECIAGAHGDGKYYLTKSSGEMGYYKNRRDSLLKKAKPLMEIYRSENEKQYGEFMIFSESLHIARKNILSSLPIYTATKEFLLKILKRNNVNESDINKITAYYSSCRERTEKILKASTISDEIPVFCEEEFNKYPAVLSLSGLFYETDITYTFGEYKEHLALCMEFSNTHKNYSIMENQRHAFRNIGISVISGKVAVVSKNKSPAVHFVVKHPALRDAIENMTVAMTE